MAWVPWGYFFEGTHGLGTLGLFFCGHLLKFQTRVNGESYLTMNYKPGQRKNIDIRNFTCKLSHVLNDDEMMKQMKNLKK